MDPKVRTIQLEGDPYQIGLGHGRLLSAEVRHLRRQVDRFVFRRLGVVRGTAVSVLFRPELMELWMGVSRKPPASHGEWIRLDAASLLRGGTKT